MSEPDSEVERRLKEIKESAKKKAAKDSLEELEKQSNFFYLKIFIYGYLIFSSGMLILGFLVSGWSAFKDSLINHFPFFFPIAPAILPFIAAVWWYFDDLNDRKESEEVIYKKSSSSRKKISSSEDKDNEKTSDAARDEEKSSGTGFFINNEGYVVTNFHVVKDYEKIKISTKKNKYNATIFATDQQNDLAILRIKTKTNTYFKFAKTDADRLENVIAVGYGFGKSISSEIKTTKGVISASAGLNNNYSQMQIDASLQPGNSGGPVINDNGSVLGVAVAKMDAAIVFDYTGSIPEGISFAIKVSTLKQFLSSNKIKYEIDGDNVRNNRDLNNLIDNGVLFITS